MEHNALLGCDIGAWAFVLNAWCFEPKIFLTSFICNSEVNVNLLATWTLLCSLNKISFYVVLYFHVCYYVHMYIWVEGVTFSGIRGGQTIWPVCYVLTIFWCALCVITYECFFLLNILELLILFSFAWLNEIEQCLWCALHP